MSSLSNFDLDRILEEQAKEDLDFEEGEKRSKRTRYEENLVNVERISRSLQATIDSGRPWTQNQGVLEEDLQIRTAEVGAYRDFLRQAQMQEQQQQQQQQQQQHQQQQQLRGGPLSMGGAGGGGGGGRPPSPLSLGGGQGSTHSAAGGAGGGDRALSASFGGRSDAEEQNAVLRTRIADLEEQAKARAAAPTGRMDIQGMNGENFRVLKNEATELKLKTAASAMAFRMLQQGWRSVLEVGAEVRDADGNTWLSGTVLPNGEVLRTITMRRAISDKSAGLERVSSLEGFSPEWFNFYTGQRPVDLLGITVSSDIAHFVEGGELKTVNHISQGLDNLEHFWVKVFGPSYERFLFPVREKATKSDRAFPIGFRIIWVQIFLYEFLAAMSQKITAPGGDVMSLVGLRNQTGLRDRLIAAQWDEEYMRDLVDNVAGQVGLGPDGRLIKKGRPKAVAPASPSHGTRGATAAAAATAALGGGGVSSSSSNSGSSGSSSNSSSSSGGGGGGSNSGSSSRGGGKKATTPFCLRHLLDKTSFTAPITNSNSKARTYACSNKFCKYLHTFPSKAVVLTDLDTVVENAGWQPLDSAWRAAITAAVYATSPWPPK